MPVDETPKPESEAAADDAEAIWQAGYDAAGDDRSWIKACLAVLCAEIDTSDFDPMSRDALREMRCAAMNRAARIFRADVESPTAE